MSIVLPLLALVPIAGFANYSYADGTDHSALVVRTCSDNDTSNDRDVLPIFAFHWPEYLYLWKTVSSSALPYQYIRHCGSTDFGVTWTLSGRRQSLNGPLANLTLASDYPGNRLANLWEQHNAETGEEHIVLGYWGTLTPNWDDNVTAPSIAFSRSAPASLSIAFQKGPKGGESVSFTHADDYVNNYYQDWAPPTAVAGVGGPTGPEPSTMPALATDAFDRVHLAYLRSNPSGRREVYYLRNGDRGADGAWTPEPGVRLSSTGVDSHDLVIAASREGQTVLVVWTATPVGSDDDLMYAYSRDGGITWQTSQTLSATAAHEGYPAIAVDPVTSTFHIVWWRNDTNATRQNNVLYAQASGADPGNWTVPQSVVDPVAAVSGTYRRPAIASFWRSGTNVVAVAWTDTRNGDEDVYMTEVTPPLQCAANASPTSGVAPLSVDFGANASGGVPPYSHFWRFGDGATSALPAASHSYGTPGVFAAALQVTDLAGNVCFDTVQIDALSPLPDLAVRSIDVVPSPSPHVEGTPLWVNATVRNLGGGSGTDVSVRLALGARGGPSLGDQGVPSIPSLTNRSVSFPWTPSSAGATTVCVVADPDDAIAEVDEGNNAGCIATSVLRRPDLALLPGDVSANTGGVPVGGAVNLTATLRNLGGSEARAVPVAFFLDEDGDRLPGMSEAFDAQNVARLAAGATTPLASEWIADRVGPLTLCVYADPNGTIPEGNETNNGACAAVTVLGPPDYAPWNPQPSSPLVSGLSQPLEFSVEVRNAGGTAANRTVILGFFNASTPGTPFATFSVPPLEAGNASSPFVATWQCPAVAGAYDVVVDVDYGDDVTEWDEGNNAYTWTVDVVAGPVTDLVVGTPSYTGAAVYVTSVTDISFSVLDKSGTGIRRTMYREDIGTWEDYAATGPFRLTGEGERFLEWSSEDYAGNVEATQSAVLRVDDTPPTTAMAIGDPKYLVGGTYVTSATPLAFAASDGGLTPVGVALSEYRVDGGPWTPYASPFSIAGDGLHVIAYQSLDALGNLEPDHTETILVDDTPPATTLGVGDPKHVSAQTFVTSSTPLSLAAVDGGVNPVGSAFTEYRVDGGSWIAYAAPFALAGDGTHLVEHRSGDLLGNVETTLAPTFVVDDTPPALELGIGTPRFPDAGRYVTSATLFAVTATDGGPFPVGIASVEYRLTRSWTPFASVFTLAGPDGPRTVEFRATDLLGNGLASAREVVLDNTPPATTPSLGAGTYPAGTTFAFTATDLGSGVARTEVRVDGGGWTPYAFPFVLGEGDHAIGFRSIDNVNNAEAERTLSVRIGGVSPPASETNWKPLVAAAFASVLALVGAWSSRRAPWATGSRRVLRAFLSTAMPFVILEGTTGVVSHVTGLLAIPPLLGVGTAVDLGILGGGIAVCGYRVGKGTGPD